MYVIISKAGYTQMLLGPDVLQCRLAEDNVVAVKKVEITEGDGMSEALSLY